ncbi:family 78 glycoside hydrolase catalytic domain [Paenibacillus sp. FSL H7-0357]|uniref:alpha-L-rhamnosidase n=1 Tax=Paenibacillus sp. FSL H7-0357 TaxID=1536774 RepID=UPI000B0ADB8D|nr:alpha-L-rhamnosidase [Paenibacillus sp. FSL H7-0357]
MEELKKHFITASNPEFIEGTVNIFAQQIILSQKEVTTAQLYMTALGVYEAELNQEKIGDQLFAPGFTYYHRDLFYQNYDVTKQLKKGENVFKVYLGQGWYNGRFTHENKTQIYGNNTAVSWILEIKYADGTSEQFVSGTEVDELASPYKYAGFYDGEVYDARIQQDAMGKASMFTGKIPECFSETTIKVKLQESMPVQKIIRKENSTILDFGQNFAGMIEINAALLDENTTLTVKHGEILIDDTTLYTENLRKAKAEIVYFAGKRKESYLPRFTYMGFRYVELTGAQYIEGLISARAIYSDMQRTGHFTSDNPLIERLFNNQFWGQKSNYVEVPTDCPQRDERMGYTGDGQVFALTGSYNYDTEVFFEKFLKDIRYSQLDNEEGYVAPTVPAGGPGGIGFINMLGWGNAVTIIPEMLYWQYGTDKHLVRQYDSIKKFVEAEIRRMGDHDLWLGPNLGDWLMPGKDLEWMAKNNEPISNSFIVHDLEVLSKLAGQLADKEQLLKKSEKDETAYSQYLADQERYSVQLQKTRAAYIEKYINDNGTVSGDYQGAYIMALKYVIPEGKLRQKVLKNFVANVEENGLNTGFFSTQFILPLLIEAGNTQLAFDVLLNEDCPGWMYQVKRGATTIWERWDALKEDGTVNDVKVVSDNMVSFNHYAFGSVGEFYYQYILGMKPLLPGYQKIQLKPYVDPRLGKVAGSYLSRAGLIKVSWAYQEEGIEFEFETPAASTIELPDGSYYEVEKGTYTYQIKRS